MKKLRFETVNKKYFRINIILRHCWICGFSSIPLFFRSFRVITRACKFGFNRNDLFFIKYFSYRDKHYKHDVKPVFDAWNNLTIESLGYHDTFNELFIKTDLEVHDRDNIGRDHLDGYYYLDDGTFLGIKRYIDTYNQTISNFIGDTKDMLTLDISQHAPILEEYDSIRNQHSSFYHLSNIYKYIWRKFWNEDIELVIRPSRPNEFELIIATGQIVIAVGDNESLEGLRTYLKSVTPNLVAQLNDLKNEREKVIVHFENFKRTIYLIMRDIRWNLAFKGKCGWEKGFWKL